MKKYYLKPEVEVLDLVEKEVILAGTTVEPYDPDDPVQNPVNIKPFDPNA